MRNKTGILSDLIHIVDQTENIYLKRELEKIKEIVDTTPNYYVLGETLKRIL